MYLLSSRYEGLPMVLLEAQAYGLPIVAFQCKCGPLDVVEHGKTGILVPEGESTALAEGIIQLIEQEATRIAMGKAARQASSRYDEARVMQQWITLFNQR